MSGSNSVVTRPIRRKGSNCRAWLVVSEEGQTEVVEAGKQLIMRRTGLSVRDLRILDPLLSNPSTMLARERAMLINLEHIKAIITAQEVLLLNSKDPSVIPFVQQLQSRILRRHRAATQPSDLKEPQSRTMSPHNSSIRYKQFQNQDGQDNADKKQVGIKILPFEFVALETCLEATCIKLENEARDELEHFLDDDEDMAEMYLTDKLAQQSNSSASSMNYGDDMENQFLEPDINDREPMFEEPNGDGSDSVNGAVTKKVDVEEVEMLLGAYFVQIGGTLNKLSTLREYVDETLDYINIMLDDKQNRLLQMGVRLATSTLLVNAFNAVMSIFGINVDVDIYSSSQTQFLEVIGGCTTACTILYVVAIAWFKRKRLLLE